ncbi:MAG: hypothetical protein ABJK20_00010 [Halieaceae bacterium]
MDSTSQSLPALGSNADAIAFRACLLLGVVIILVAIWKNPFLPMQDLPQHLYMAWVANNYSDAALGLDDAYLLRDQFGPYRATYLLQRLFSVVVTPTTSVRVIVSLYVLLVAALAWQLQRFSNDQTVAWAALLLLPAAMHPMYFYGFLNFTFSIPVLLFALLNMRQLLLAESVRAFWQQGLWVGLLFLIHPYTLLVYTVLVLASTAVLARGRNSLLLGLVTLFFCLTLFFGWMIYASPPSSAAGSASLLDAKLVWWPSQYTLKFLAMMFTGMRFNAGVDWATLAIWVAVIPLMVLGYWRCSNNYAAGLWLPVLAVLALAGFFALPFSVQTDARFTFFGVRMAPIFLFLLVAAVSTLPLHSLAGRMVAIAALSLTVSGAVLHDRVAKEVAEISPVIDKMRAGEAVLPLISNSRSTYLDPVFFAQFHYHGVFYYHLLSPGGANPDLFHNRLMPVAFKAGGRPPRPPQRQLYRWPEYHQHYRYVLSRGLDPRIHSQLQGSTQAVAKSGDWHLYDLGEPAR